MQVSKNLNEKYILIGNGLNRCLKNSISWGDLLKSVADDYHVDYNPELPMPLEFERILNKTLKNISNSTITKSSIICEIKNRIASFVSNCKLDEAAIHHELKDLKVSGFLTTNYDYMIENVFDPNYSYDGPKKRKYLFDRTAEIESKKFFHLHGISGCNESLCLGYEHYVGLVEKERIAINTKRDNKSQEMLIKRILCGEDKESGCFYEKFYTSDIAIIGLSLDTCEVDLWWLLTHRAYLYNSNYALMQSKGILNNRIVYYGIILDKKNDDDLENKLNVKQQQENILSLLRDMHVEVIVYRITDARDYEKTYSKILNNIKISL